MTNPPFVLSLPDFLGSGSATFPARPTPYRILAVSLHIVTDATAASRQPRISTTLEGVKVGVFGIEDVNQNVTASLSREISWFPGGATRNAGSAILQASLPNNGIRVTTDQTVVIQISGGVAGDVCSNVFALIQDLDELRPGDMPRRKGKAARFGPDLGE